MTDRATAAEVLQKELLAQLDREMRDLEVELDCNDLVPVSEIKSWRRGWIDRAVEIRALARRADSDGADGKDEEIVELAKRVEERARDHESQLIDIARALEDAEERGGILTHEERVARAEGASIADAARARVEALRQVYLQQLETEKQGLETVLEADRARTGEFENALDDATVRLDRIWERIRRAGNEVFEQLSELDAPDPVNSAVEAVLSELDALTSSTMAALRRSADVAPQHAGSNREESSLDPQTRDFLVGVERQVDEAMQTLNPLEEEYRRCEQACITNGTPSNRGAFEAAARAMYEGQLAYIKDPEKRRAAAERYADQAVRDLPGSRDQADDGVQDGIQIEPAAANSAEELSCDVRTVCETLFGPQANSIDSARIFSESYDGRTVRWSGTLISSVAYPFDFIFGGEPGTKAILEIFELSADSYGGRKVLGVLQLPVDAHGRLEDACGTQFEFRGRFLRSDGLQRSLYFADAELL